MSNFLACSLVIAFLLGPFFRLPTTTSSSYTKKKKSATPGEKEMCLAISANNSFFFHTVILLHSIYSSKSSRNATTKKTKVKIPNLNHNQKSIYILRFPFQLQIVVTCQSFLKKFECRYVSGN